VTVIQSDEITAAGARRAPGTGTLLATSSQEQWEFISDLDIIILNYNTVDLLRPCLESVFASKCNFRWRVFVVDNGSSDKSAEMVRSEFEPFHDNLTFIASPVNGGYAFGNNLAMRLICPLPPEAEQPDLSPAEQVERKLLHIGSQPQARYILLLNPDSIVPPDAFQVVYDFAEANPDVGVVGPKLVKANGELDLACRRSFPTPEVSLYRMLGLSKLFPKSRRFGRYNLTYMDVDTTTEVDSVVGAFMLLRAEVIRQAGILDEAYFMYGEDLDWAFRIKNLGWKIMYYPATTVLHLKGESSKKRSYGALVNFYQAMFVFYRKHYARDTFFLLNWLIYLGILGKGSLALLRNALRPGTRKRVS
jgi:N-acetylglucosaminyl-diphospho-decaprenol L-rhamnosyltransferase